MWLEIFVFSIFLLLGLISFFFIPPQRTQQRVCGCTWYTNVGWWLIGYWFLLWSSLTFCLYCLLVFFFYDLDQYATRLPSVAEGDRLLLIPLAIASVISLIIVILGSCIARVWWSILSFGIFLSFYVHSLVPCDTKTCFYLRSGLSVTLSFAVSAATTTLLFRCIGDAIYAVQDSLLFAFTVVFSICVLAFGLDHWTGASMLIPLVVTILTGVLRVAFVSSWEYCNCCRDYSPLSE